MWGLRAGGSGSGSGARCMRGQRASALASSRLTTSPLSDPLPLYSFFLSLSFFSLSICFVSWRTIFTLLTAGFFFSTRKPKRQGAGPGNNVVKKLLVKKPYGPYTMRMLRHPLTGNQQLSSAMGAPCMYSTPTSHVKPYNITSLFSGYRQN